MADAVSRNLSALATLHNVTLMERITTLRQVYIALDFDVFLWDCLFQKDLMEAAAAAATSISCTKNKNCCATTTGSTTASTTTVTTKSLGNATTAPLSLRAVLEFIEIGNYTNVPDEYLGMEPASVALKEFQHHHGHLHDSLLHAVCLALAHSSSALYVQCAKETAESVQELERMYDSGIAVLTRINHRQLMECHHQQEDIEAPSFSTTAFDADIAAMDAIEGINISGSHQEVLYTG